MIVSVSLAVFCLLIGGATWSLSPTAGRLPAIVASLTLAVLLAQLRQDWRATPAPRPAAETPDWRSCLLLVSGVYLAGFLVSLPLFAAWSWRKRPAVATGAMAAVFFALALLNLQFELHPGILWPR
jgi:hypothetical protein